MLVEFAGCGEPRPSYYQSLRQTRQGKNLLWGRVLRADGTPVAGALVRIGRILPRGVEYNTTTTESDGFYTYDLEANYDTGGDFVLSMNPEYGPIHEPIVPAVVQTQKGKRQPAVDFILRGTGTVVGKVVDDLGKPVGFMPLVVPDVPGNSSSNEVGWTMTDQQGHFTMTVPAGKPYIETRPDGSRPWKQVGKLVSVQAGQRAFVRLTAPRLTVIDQL